MRTYKDLIEWLAMTEDETKMLELERKILSIESSVLVKVTSLESSIHNLQQTITTFVSNERFNPVAYIAYGLAAGVLTTALGAVLSKVFI